MTVFLFLKNNRVSQDTSSLVQCYLPIIGQEALSLYLYAITFLGWWAKEHLFANILIIWTWDEYAPPVF